MGMMNGGHMQAAVYGTVSAINGSTLTVLSKAWEKPNGDNENGDNEKDTPVSTSAPITYTVNASAATITKNGATSTLSAITVNDTVRVEGTVSGTSVTATKIFDGVMPPKPENNHKAGGTGKAKNDVPTPIFKGNGQPIVAGSVTAVSSTTLTLTNKSNVTYTVDASSAIVEKGNATSTLASVVSGDNVIVQGTVNGTSIVASSVIDQGATSNTNGDSNSKNNKKSESRGFFGSIGNFFSHLFGF